MHPMRSGHSFAVQLRIGDQNARGDEYVTQAKSEACTVVNMASHMNRLAMRWNPGSAVSRTLNAADENAGQEKETTI